MTLQYIARKIADLNEPNTWTRIRVGVFEVRDDVESQIGEYVRNYGLMSTFFHFQRNGKDYALYSPHYTCTRIMELPSCRDLGGEEPASNGFCPVEYYVPCYIERVSERLDGKSLRYTIVDPQPQDFEPAVHSKIEKSNMLVTPSTYTSFGFVAGCIWGDDWSWKVQLLDLSQADKGVISREARFGYLPLPKKLTLRDSLYLDNFEATDESWRIVIATQRGFDFKTGQED